MKRMTATASLVLALPCFAWAGPTLPGTAMLALPHMQPAGGGGAPMITISKKCPELRYVGRDATYEITVVNQGSGAAQNVVVTDTISGQIEFVSADNEGSREGNNITWRLGTLEAGDQRTLTTTFRCNVIGRVTNSARVSWCAEAMAQCEMDVRGIPAILLECVDDPDPIELNGQVTYTIVVTNQGSAVGTNIVIDCTLPDEEEHVSTAGPTNANVEGKRVTFAPLPSLAPKASASFKVTVKGVAVGDVRFRVDMTSDQTDSPVMETESTHIYN